MKIEILLAGVGGQGILAPATILAAAAIKRGWYAKQSEVHGMAQRGGSVQAQVILSEEPVSSELIAEGCADMILSMEPLESLRYVSYLAPDGELLTSGAPVQNIPDYPELESLFRVIKSLPHATIVDAAGLARLAGSALAANMVMLGAASTKLAIPAEAIEAEIRSFFMARGEKIVEINVKAFRAGREVAP
jgi:indolepyruvate ferredoxin oxidoreductase beta subunit